MSAEQSSSEKVSKWTQKLNESHAALKEMLAPLTPEQWETPVFSEGSDWTVATALGHLADSERGMSIHVNKIRKGEETVPEGFDIDRWNAGVSKRIGDATPEQIMAQFDAIRAKTLEVMSTIKDEEWELTGRHPSRGVITVEQYYETIHGHEQIHTADMRKALE